MRLMPPGAGGPIDFVAHVQESVRRAFAPDRRLERSTR